MSIKVEGLISTIKLIQTLKNTKVGEKMFLNIETIMSEDLKLGLMNGFQENGKPNKNVSKG